MTGPKIKLFAANDGVVHWAYPMAGRLTVCGQVALDGRHWHNGPPTCVRCIAMVQAGLEGDLTQWRAGNDPTKKLG